MFTMEFLTQLIMQAAGQVWITFTHNWPFLIISTLVAVGLKLFLDPQKVSALLSRYQSGGVVGATLLAVGTPLCSCGTTAVVLGMMASMIPWAPIIAFMVSSPLTSPEELIYSAGLFGWPFALAFFFASILLGLLGGLAGWFFESHGWLKNQARLQQAPSTVTPQSESCNCTTDPAQPLRPELAFATSQPAGCSCSTPSVPAPSPMRVLEIFPTATTASCSCEAAPDQAVRTNNSLNSDPMDSSCGCSSQPQAEKQSMAVSWKTFLAESWSTGRRLLAMFLGFAFIGYFLNGLIPAEWVNAIFGRGNLYSVPLAATLGLPLYLNTEASLPLVRALIDGGMSQGAALAFLITGAGTSIGAVMGALTIARWRVMALVVATLWFGAIVVGASFDLLLMTGVF
jgi:uncharacterized protein